MKFFALFAAFFSIYIFLMQDKETGIAFGVVSLLLICFKLLPVVDSLPHENKTDFDANKPHNPNDKSI